MQQKQELKARAQFLKKVIVQQLKHLLYSDKQVFKHAITIEKMQNLATDEVFAEQVEAFGSRFSRLQDTIGQKLLPLWLKLLGEPPAAFIDNLNKAEKLGVLPSAEEWIRLRELRNQMVHEYIDDVNILCNALKSAHAFVPSIQKVTDAILNDLQTRGHFSRQQNANY